MVAVYGDDVANVGTLHFGAVLLNDVTALVSVHMNFKYFAITYIFKSLNLLDLELLSSSSSFIFFESLVYLIDLAATLPVKHCKKHSPGRQQHSHSCLG